MKGSKGTPWYPTTARLGAGEAESQEGPPGFLGQLLDSIAVDSLRQAARPRAHFPFLSHLDTPHLAAGSYLGKPC